MARTRFNDPIEPMDLGNMRANGVRSLWVQCYQCRHDVILKVDHLPDHVTVPSFGRTRGRTGKSRRRGRA